MDTVVRADYRSQGVGGKLIDVRYQMIRRMNLRGLVAGSLINDYAAVAHEITAEAYVQEVIAGTRFDSNLSKQLRKGFVVHGLIPNYSDNAASRNWGVEIVWRNPDYRRPRRVFTLPQPRSYRAPLLPNAA